jgi:hypothetical protein
MIFELLFKIIFVIFSCVIPVFIIILEILDKTGEILDN